MSILVALFSYLLAATSVSIVEPLDGEAYDGDWLPFRVIVENENEIPDSVHYSLNGSSATLIQRLNTDWPTYMQNYHNTGYSESPAPTDNTVLWSAYVKGFFHEFPTPVVVDGMVYYTEDSLGHGTNDSLYAFDASTGQLIWKYNTGFADDAVTVVDGRLYSAARDSIFCLDALTGEKYWSSSEANSSGSTPIVSGGRVYCANSIDPENYAVVCLDAENASVIWIRPMDKMMASCMGLWNGMLLAPTMYMGGGVKGSLYGINAETGEILWENTDASNGYWDSSPTLIDGIAYINDWESDIYAIDAQTGGLVWERSGNGATATIAYGYGNLFFGSESSPYYCLDSSNGSTLWTSPYHQHGSSAIADGTVFFGESYAVNDSSRVLALDCSTGEQVWSFKTSCGGSLPGFQSSPSVVDGVMYYTCTDGYLYAFGTGLKYTYKEDFFYTDLGSNELIVTSWNNGTAVAADTINFTVTQTGITLEPSRHMRLRVSPNPMQSTASFSFDLDESGKVSLSLYDLTGREVTSLVSQELVSGTHSFQWNGCGDDGHLLSSGLYLCRINCGGVTETTGLCVLR